MPYFSSKGPGRGIRKYEVSYIRREYCVEQYR